MIILLLFFTMLLNKIILLSSGPVFSIIISVSNLQRLVKDASIYLTRGRLFQQHQNFNQTSALIYLLKGTLQAFHQRLIFTELSQNFIDTYISLHNKR